MAKMKAPANGVAVRMYRQGHGDCFLLAMPRVEGGDPVYVLIDCGYKGGSPAFVHGKEIDETVQHIAASTGNRLDLVIITHEHEDHVNGFGTSDDDKFAAFTIDEAWFAWTEDPDDAVANELRRRHKDQLLTLVEARVQLALAAGDNDPTVRRLDSLLSLEIGEEAGALSAAMLRAAASDPAKSKNKQAMKLIKDKAAAQQGIRFLKPTNAPQRVRGTDLRAFVLGPPRDPDLLDDEDPIGGEGFPDGEGASHGLSFGRAVMAASGARVSPFDQRFHVRPEAAASHPFFARYYGSKGDANEAERNEAASNAAWRRIDEEWLYAADYLALKLNEGINNTSLVLAFELPQSKKVLLFAGDAQRGNWISWDDQSWHDGEREISARDLLSRTVLYKVGHHGSHNATLDGSEDDDYPNLAWMSKEPYAEEFTAMITAVNGWALKVKPYPWRHPLPAIKTALVQKARGRVFQTDTGQLEQPSHVSEAEWQRFLGRATVDELYFELQILDESEEEPIGPAMKGDTAPPRRKRRTSPSPKRKSGV